jgi:hypothetical protein
MSLKIASLRQTLTYRTQALKLRTLPHGPDQVKDYNAQATQEGGERIEDFNDPFRIDWLEEKDGPNVIVGSEVRASIVLLLRLIREGGRSSRRVGRDARVEWVDQLNTGLEGPWTEDDRETSDQNARTKRIKLRACLALS